MTPDGERIANGASLEVRGLVKRYGDVVSVDNVSWRAEPGEFIALLGSSGCGKSTSLLMIAGLIEPTAGDVLIDGVAVTALPPERRNIGMVFQDYALFPHLSLRDNVAFGLRMRGIDRRDAARRADKTLDLVGLGGLGSRRPGALSGGQRQRVALARALVYEPPVLLMDEPLGALDKQLREQMQHELRRLHRELGLTILYVTHDQREALTMADRLAVMRAGRIEQIGTPAEVFARPTTRFVASFIGDCSFLKFGAALAVGAGLWRVDIAGWEGVVRGPNQLEGTSELAIRPHDVRLAVAGEPGLQATVVDAVFEGETYEYILATVDGQAIAARISAAAHDRTPRAPGDLVSLTWAIDTAWLV
jgi:ABC-type Fe3+/spermidine/putrescine transport system ATPase subunit